MSLSEAINGAAAEIEKQLNSEETGVESTKTEETTEAAETEDGETEADSTDESIEADPADNDESNALTDDQIKEAQNLYKSLQDPVTAKLVIAGLAERLGLNKAETKTEVKESKKSIQEILKTALGPEFEFLSDKIGKGIEEVLNQEKAERNELAQQEKSAQVAQEVKTAWKDLEKTTNGRSKTVEAKMNELAKNFLPGPTVSVKTYLGQLYTLATASTPNSDKKVIDTIKKNQSDTSGRLRAVGGAADNTKMPPPGKMNINQAVAWAAQQLEGKQK